MKKGTILVAIDGSRASKKVVDYAIDLAKSMSGRISLLYVVPELGVPDEYQRYARAEGIDTASYYDQVGTRLVDDFASDVKGAGVDCDATYSTGPAFQRILEAVKESDADLIVVGLRGLHGLGRVRALGSTARRILENSSVPVVVVPV
jgi:nucleotide-binding universal stress UspA family protein